MIYKVGDYYAILDRDTEFMYWVTNIQTGETERTYVSYSIKENPYIIEIFPNAGT